MPERADKAEVEAVEEEVNDRRDSTDDVDLWTANATADRALVEEMEIVIKRA